MPTNSRGYETTSRKRTLATPAFEIDMFSLLPFGFAGGLGGPTAGGHHSPDCYIQCGKDIVAGEAIKVFAAFDVHVTIRFDAIAETATAPGP